MSSLSSISSSSIFDGADPNAQRKSGPPRSYYHSGAAGLQEVTIIQEPPCENPKWPGYVNLYSFQGNKTARRFKSIQSELSLLHLTLKNVTFAGCVADIIGQSSNLLSLELQFSELGKQVPTKDEWLGLCKGMRRSSSRLRQLLISDAAAEYVSMESALALKGLPLVDASPLVPSLVLKAPLFLKDSLPQTLLKLDLQSVNFKAGPRIALVISENASALQMLSLPKQGTAAGTLAQLALPMLLTLSLDNGDVTFGDILNVASRCTRLIKFAAYSCRGAGISNAGIYHLYRSCLSLTNIQVGFASKNKSLLTNDVGCLIEDDLYERREDKFLLRDSYTIEVEFDSCYECGNETDFDLSCPICDYHRCSGCIRNRKSIQPCSGCGDLRYCEGCIYTHFSAAGHNIYLCGYCRDGLATTDVAGKKRKRA
eukprot:CAMPEP_0171993720 /NCGR_PEP_ID=MMETSP0993-20121228/278589_1 /TAXON_ID=483369 /ORGANISM="non described non described, Strain CCMP2098" /LENGTH=425 /DNA_ID=CAMNT_0012646783 /DNA_START=294 /DNA_END=1572 /DNA_ORIENTATION=-